MKKYTSLILAVIAITAAIIISDVWFRSLIQAAVDAGDENSSVLSQIFLVVYQPMAAGVLAFGLYSVGAFLLQRSLKKLSAAVLLGATFTSLAALVVTVAWEVNRLYLMR
jgi:hypothetical protein